MEALAAQYELHLGQLDVESAFLSAISMKKFILKALKSFKRETRMTKVMCKPNETTFSLKQANESGKSERLMIAKIFHLREDH